MSLQNAFAWALGFAWLGCGGSLSTDGPGDGGPDASVAGGNGGTSAAGGGMGAGGMGAGGMGTGGTGAGGAGGADWSACGAPGECVAQTNGCCSPCAMPELANFAGVNARFVDVFRSITCPVPVPCPRCATFPNPYIGARCAAGRCEAFDVRRETAISGCIADTDCHLRKGLDCCECGAQGAWTAVGLKGESVLMSMQCAPASGCATCAPVPPPGTTAVCRGGHCEVVQQ